MKTKEQILDKWGDSYVDGYRFMEEDEKKKSLKPFYSFLDFYIKETTDDNG